MDHDRIVEIGARTLFDDWQAARGQLYGHKAMKWDREPHHQKRFRSQCRAVLAAFEEAGLVVEQGWRPIETAPKDGRPLLLGKYGWASDASFQDGKHFYSLWWATRGFWSERWRNWNDGVEPAGLAAPSHWRPMPQPPEDLE